VVSTYGPPFSVIPSAPILPALESCSRGSVVEGVEESVENRHCEAEGRSNLYVKSEICNPKSEIWTVLRLPRLFPSTKSPQKIRGQFKAEHVIQGQCAKNVRRCRMLGLMFILPYKFGNTDFGIGICLKIYYFRLSTFFYDIV